MKIIKINNLTEIINHHQPLACIWGFFDGWHLGHQLLVETLIKTAEQDGYKTLVISFDHKPQGVLNHKKEKVLFNQTTKREFLKQKRIDYYWEFNFTTKFAKITAQQFLVWLSKNQIKTIVTNEALNFGHNREGNYQMLLKQNFKVIPCHDVLDKNGIKVTTSYLKQKLKNHDITTVNYYLNQNYTLTGVVVDGIKVGRKLGFPTANLKLNANYFLPDFGIYLTQTFVKTKWYNSLTLILNRNNHPLVESYLLNFNDDIYGQTIKVSFLQFLRPIETFKTESELIEKIKADVQAAEHFFANNR